MCGPNSNGSGPPGAGQASHGHRPLRDSIDFLLHGRGQESTVDRQNYERSPIMCGGGSSPEQDLDDPDYDAFRISRRARGRKDGPWNRFVPLAGTVLVILGIRRVRSA
jgi:hypothetical protein